MALTTAGLIIGGLLAGGSTAANVYNTRSAGRQNRRAQDLQAEEGRRALEDAAEERRLLAEQAAADRAQRAEDRALRAEEERARRALDERKQTETQARWTQAMAQDQTRWQDYLRANEPHWNFGGRVLGNLYDLAGMQGGAPAMPDTAALSGMSFDARSSAAPGVGGAPLLPLDTMASGGVPVSTTRPVPMAPSRRRSWITRRPFATVARPAAGGMALSDLASLAAMASSRTPIQGRTIMPDLAVTRAPR